MRHPELTAIIETFGSEHPISIAAATYFQYHPTHSFCPTIENNWWVGNSGGVVTPTMGSDPDIFSELWFCHGSFYEAVWYGDDLESVLRDGEVIFNGAVENDSIENRLCTFFGADSVLDIFEDAEAAYRLRLNPLPQLRKAVAGLPFPVEVRFDGSNPATQRDLQASVGRALLSIVLDDDGAIWWAVVPPGEFTQWRQRTTAIWKYWPGCFGHPKPPRRPIVEGPQPAPGPRKVAPKE
jgi:hypothetical protein